MYERASLETLNIWFEYCISALERRENSFVTYRKKPKEGVATQYRMIDAVAPKHGFRLATVIQGPPFKNDQFTFETIRYYRTISPETIVVISCWEDEDPAFLKACETLGSHVVVSKKPEVAGRRNVNFQIASTFAGIQKAKDLGADYVAKTRSDTRLYAYHQLEMLPSLLQYYPVRGGAFPRQRIISTSQYTLKYCPIHLSDLFMFGTVNDMLDYWSLIPDSERATREAADPKSHNPKTFDDVICHAPEYFLLDAYLKRIARNTDTTIANWWGILSDCLMIVDWEMLDIYWPKYDPHVEARRIDYSAKFSHANSVTFTDWLLMYHQQSQPFEPPEFIRKALPPYEVGPVRVADLVH